MDASALTIFILMLVGLMIGIFSGYYLFIVLGALGLLFGLIFWGEGVINLITLNAFDTIRNYSLLAIPLFIFMGNVIDRSGIAERLFHALSINLGSIRGGLAISALLISILFGASTGVVGATVVTMGVLFLPAMLKRNYNKSMATGVICAGGTLGVLIPPSIMLILYGPAAGISVGQLFYAALIPGLLMGFLYIVYVLVRSYTNPTFAPAIPKEELAQYSTKDKVIGILHILPVLAIVFAVLGSIWFGIAPPTEAAAVGAFASLIVAAAYRELNFTVIKESLYRTLQVSAMVYAIIIFAGFFVSVFMRLGGGRIVEQAILAIPLEKWGIFIMMMLIVFVLGLLMDWIASILIIIPIFTPIAAMLGFDPIWFATMVCIMYQTSFLTPPFAYSIFYLKGVAPKEVQTSDIMRGVWPFVGIQVLTLILCALFPEIVLWLPNKMIGN
ncbi:TRAP transporter large permease [Alkalihalobacterium alkalinitrilicum]|uniref:TRAP transporter large permease n=1 Tax=Alkalihalobacterium alkalinitrilicum TaxID=427920 RepID=UPI000994C1E7|nr:TRAP transporter large permease subunit [Alkalihalobacterium alkalinitrilicum]